MTFSMRGKLGGIPIVVGWRDGGLSGKFVGNAIFARFARAHEGIRVQGIATGPTTTGDHLSNPFSAIALFRMFVDDGAVEFGGNPPRLPRVPRDAIP